MNRFLTLLASLIPFGRRADTLALTVQSPRSASLSAGGVANPQSRIGMMGYDAGASALPTPAYRLSVADQDTLYEDNGYARRLVDEVVDDALRKGWRVLVGEGEGEEDAKLRALDEQLHLKARIEEAAKAGRRYGTAYLLMVFDEQTNGIKEGKAALQLERAPKQVKAIRNLVLLDPEECIPVLWDTDPRSPTYREPLVYHVMPSGEAGMTGGGYVHASRLLIFRGHRLSPKRRALNHYRDLSVLQPAWQQIANLTQADSALATNLQDASMGVLKVAGKAELELGDQWAYTEGRLAEIAVSRSRARLLVLDEGEDYSVVAHPQSGLSDQHTRLREGLSAVSGIPQTRYFGLAPGGLNADGESQASSWREQIASYQQGDLLPELERYYTYQQQALGRPEAHDWSIQFLPLDEPTSAQAAAVYKLNAEADALYFDRGVIAANELRRARFARRPSALVVEEELPEDGEGDEEQRGMVEEIAARRSS